MKTTFNTSTLIVLMFFCGILGLTAAAHSNVDASAGISSVLVNQQRMTLAQQQAYDIEQGLVSSEIHTVQITAHRNHQD